LPESGGTWPVQIALEEVLAYARELNVLSFVPCALVNLADLAIAEGRLAEARTLCEEAVSLAQRRRTSLPWRTRT
jgi:hypothetical protein